LDVGEVLSAKVRSIVALVVLVLGLVSWVAFLGGVGASHKLFYGSWPWGGIGSGGSSSSSNNDDYDDDGGSSSSDYDDGGGSAADAIGSLNPLGMSWFLVIAQFLILVSATVLLSKGSKGESVQAFVLLLAVQVAWLGTEADEAWQFRMVRTFLQIVMMETFLLPACLAACALSESRSQHSWLSAPVVYFARCAGYPT
jgi:hypothetical protein